MSYFKFLAKEKVYFFEELRSLTHRDIPDGYMSTQGIHSRGQGPDVEIMNIHDTFNPMKGTAQCLNIEILWGCFQKNINGFMDQTNRPY